jgi:hypothetical protein
MNFTSTFLFGSLLIACSSDSLVTSDDASLGDSSKQDSGTADVATNDVGANDAKVDAPSMDSGADVGPDVSVTDASDGAVDDAGGCTNVVCNKGSVCCNIQKSFNYGKCYNPACLACCQ